MILKKCLFAVLVLMLVTTVSAQKAGKNNLEETMRQFREAMITADSIKLVELVSEKLSYGHSSGVVDNKNAFISKLVSGQSDFVTIELSEENILISKGVAVVRHILKAKTNDNGKPGEVNLRILLIWQKEDKHWRLLARQAVKI